MTDLTSTQRSSRNGTPSNASADAADGLDHPALPAKGGVAMRNDQRVGCGAGRKPSKLVRQMAFIEIGSPGAGDHIGRGRRAADAGMAMDDKALSHHGAGLLRRNTADGASIGIVDHAAPVPQLPTRRKRLPGGVIGHDAVEQATAGLVCLAHAPRPATRASPRSPRRSSAVPCRGTMARRSAGRRAATWTSCRKVAKSPGGRSGSGER